MSNIFSDKRKLFGTILGIIMFALTVISITYAYYSWRSTNTVVTFSFDDNIFYCETGVNSSVNNLSPVTNYRSGTYQSFIVKNIGRSDTTFSLTMNVTNISSDIIKHESFKYKLVYDPTGGDRDCTQADATSNGSGNTCINVTNGTGNFSNIHIGMNTLIQSINLPNNSKYQYYFFMYLDGQGGQTPSGIQNQSMTSTLGVCDIYSIFDLDYIKTPTTTYQIGGSCASVSPDCLKLTANSTYATAKSCDSPNGNAVGLPNTNKSGTVITRESTVVSFNANASGVTNPSNLSVSYNFGGWYAANTFTGSAITDSTSVSITENQILYAKWVPNTPSSGSITLPAAPSRPGYRFDGWYTAASGGTRVGGAGDSYLPTDCTKTLYAHWTANSITVNVKKDNAVWSSSGVKICLSTSNSTNTFNPDTWCGTATDSYTFTSDGTHNIVAGDTYYVWIGKDANHKTDMVYSEHSEQYFTAVAGSNNAKTVNYYTLIMRGNKVGSLKVNGSDVNNAGSVIVASNYNHSITGTADTGYTFSNWSKTAGGGTVTFGNASQANTTANVTVNSATITATATIASYTITVNAGCGVSTLAASDWTNTGTASISKSFEYNSTVNLSSLVTPTYKNGYSGTTFVKASGSGTLNATTFVFTVGAGAATITVNATALAAPTCAISGGATKVYNYQDTELTASNSTSYDSGVTLSYQYGYAADNSTAFASFANGNVSGSPNKYKVTKALYRGSRFYGTKITATGCNSLSNTCTTAAGSGTEVVFKNKKLTFNATANSGTLNGTGTLYIAYDNASVYTTATGTATGTIPTASREGYVFDGWYTTQTTGGVKVVNANGTLVASATDGSTVWTNANSRWANISVADATLYARFTANSYTITYKDCGNTTFSGTHTTGYPTNYVYGVGATLDSPTKQAYSFSGYYTTSACSGTPVTAVGTTEYGNKTYYAKWTGNTYVATIYYNSNASTGGFTASTATVSCQVTSGTSCTVTLDSTTANAVITSVGKYNSPNVGVVANTSSMSSPSYTITLSGNADYYAVYSKQLRIYYPTSESAATYSDSLAIYRNEYFTSKTAIGSAISSSGTSTSAISSLSITGFASGYTIAGLNSSKNTSDYVSISSVSSTYSYRNSATTDYYAVGTKSVSKSCYYNTLTNYNNANGVASISTADASGTQSVYVSSTVTAASVDYGYDSFVAPSIISNSYGPWGGAYTGFVFENSICYAYYSRPLMIYYPNASGGVSSTSSALYRHEYFVSNNYIDAAVNTIPNDNNMSPVDFNQETDLTHLSLPNISGTLLGLATSLNSVNYYGLDTSVVRHATTGIYYAVTRISEDITIYYNSNTTVSRFTPSTATVPIHSNNFCKTTSIQGTLHGNAPATSFYLPSVVTNSVGKWNTPYHGVASALGSVTTVGSLTGGSAYYAVYGAGETSGGTGAVDSNVTEYYYATGTSSTYSYTGGRQSFTAPSKGSYKIELWGAQGGQGGKGAYTSGILDMNSGDTLYIYVGGQGPSNASVTNVGGWNGGGYSGDYNTRNSYGGGGATDVRLVQASSTASVWNEVTSLRSRIMVAGGGGGSTNDTTYTHYPGVGGALIGGLGEGNYNAPDSGGGNQTGPGAGPPAKQGLFGYAIQSYVNGFGGGGGGGYWGGYTGHGKPGGGGSSYISGYKGAVGVASASSSYPKSGCATDDNDVICSYHYSGKIFMEPFMASGGSVMPTHDGASTMIGNSGNGYAKITKVGETRNLYRNEYFSSASAMTTVLSDSLIGTTNTTPSGGAGSSLWYGYTHDRDGSSFSQKYPYNGNVQTFTATNNAFYQVQLWGAKGGNGANGGYTSGNIFLNQSDNLYLYVGQMGPTNASVTNVGGWNGGGYSGNNSGSNSYGGGGATDARLVRASSTSTVWNEATSLRSRIMVAGGGGGGFSTTSYTQTPGIGGNLTGGTGTGSYSSSDAGGGTQTGPGIANAVAKQGLFGSGIQTNATGWGGGGGGGYWGGSTGNGKPGGGGSSYISGYTGAVAVESSESSDPKTGCANGTTDVNCSYHYSGKRFRDSVMINGTLYKSHAVYGITADGSNNVASGNGYARITQVGTSVPTRTYNNVSAAAQSTDRTLYGMYQMNVNYQAGTHVDSVGITTDNCLLKFTDSSCNVPAPSITPNDGYNENGWSTIQNDSNYGTIENDGINVNTNNQIYYGNAKAMDIEITYSSGDLMYGLDDIGTTAGISDVASSSTSYMNYSITDGTVTVTTTSQYGYGFTTGRVYLEAGHTYRFSCTIDEGAVWGQTAGTGQYHALFALNGTTYNSSPYYNMSSNEGYTFTPSTTGTYWLRLQVYANGATGTFSDIFVEEIYEVSTRPYGSNYVVPNNPALIHNTFDHWENEITAETVTNSTPITVPYDHKVIARWNPDTLVTYSSGNIITGMYDVGTTPGYNLYNSTTSYMNYSISTDPNSGVQTVTVTSTRDDGFGYIPARFYLKAGSTYRFHCETDGTWGASVSSDDVEALIVLNGYTAGPDNTWKALNATDIDFTVSITGEYWLRFDVNQNGHTYHFWNISIEEIHDEIYVPYNSNYILPSSNPTWNEHQFVGWYTEKVGGTQVTGSTSKTINEDHTVYAHWNKTVHVFYEGIAAMVNPSNRAWDALYNDMNGHNNSTTVWNALKRNNDSDATLVNATWGSDYVQFNGTNAYVKLNSNSSSSTNTFVIEAMFMLDDYGSGGVIFANMESGGVALYHNSTGQIVFSYWNGSAYVENIGPSLALNKKYHVATTYNNGVVKIYINGVLVLTKTNATGNIVGSSVSFSLGCNPKASGCDGTYFNGKIYGAGFNYGLIGESTIISSAGKNITSLSDLYTNLPTPNRDAYNNFDAGYTFDGWYDTPDFMYSDYGNGTLAEFSDITLYAKWAQNLTTTFYDNEYNLPLSVTNGTSNGVTYSWNSSNHYLTLNGTQTATFDFATSATTLGYGDEWDIVLRRVSGTYTRTGSAYLTLDARNGSSNVSTRNWKDCTLPTSGSTTYTYAPSLVAAQEATGIKLMLYVPSSGAFVFYNYVVQIDIVKRKTTYYNGTYWNDLSRHKNATISNGSFVAPSGGNDGYLQFNGSSSWGNLGQITGISKYTIDADIMVDSLATSEHYIVGNIEGGGFGIRYSTVNGSQRFSTCAYLSGWQCSFTDTVPSLNDSDIVSIGVRYSVVGVYDGSKIRTYVKNLDTYVEDPDNPDPMKGYVLTSERTVSGSVGNPGNSTVMALGVNANGSSPLAPYFNGKYYRVKIANTNLSSNLWGSDYIDSSVLRYYKATDSVKTHYETVSEVSGEHYILGTTPTPPPGRNVKGWYRATSNSTSVDSTTTVNYNYNHALFAQYMGYAVRIHYYANGGEWAGSTDTSLGLHKSGYVMFANGTRNYTASEYGTTINLPDWNNPSYINIKKIGYVGKSGAQWCKTTNGTGTCYDHAVNYNSNDFCDASVGDCDVDLYVNWTRNFTCANHGQTVSYGGKSGWYVADNDTVNRICEIFYPTQSNATGSYTNALSNLNSAFLISGGADYNATLATTIIEEGGAGLIVKNGNYYIDTDCGTTESAVPGQWWYWDGLYYDSSTRYTYSKDSNVFVVAGMSNNNALPIHQFDTLSTTATYPAGIRVRNSSYSTDVWSAGANTPTHKISGNTYNWSEWFTDFGFSLDSDLGNGAGTASKIKYQVDRWHIVSLNGSEGTNYWDRSAAKLTVKICGGSYSGKTVVFTPVSTAKYHYKHNGTGTDKSYNYSGDRSYQFAGRATRTCDSNDKCTNDMQGDTTYCKNNYYTYTISNLTVALHYRPRIRVKY